MIEANVKFLVIRAGRSSDIVPLIDLVNYNSDGLTGSSLQLLLVLESLTLKRKSILHIDQLNA